MKNLFQRWKMFYCLMVVSCMSPAALARGEGPTFSLGVGFEVASGKYGTGTSADSIYLPVTLAIYPTQRLGFSLEIPYVYQSSSAVNTTVFTGSGARIMAGMRKQAAAMTGSPGGSGPAGGGTQGPPGTSGMSGTPGSMSTATTARSNESHGGLGDITAKAGYVLVPEGDLVPRVRPYVFVKFPTADRDNALGTGEFDEGFAVEFSKLLGNWYFFAEAGYTFQGTSPLLPLKDYLSYSAGTGYIVGERFLPMFVLKGSGAPVEGADDLLEMRIKLKYLATSQTGIEGYVAKGVTRSTPDYGSGLAIFYDF